MRGMIRTAQLPSADPSRPRVRLHFAVWLPGSKVFIVVAEPTRTVA